MILHGEMSEWLSAYAAKLLVRDISPELALELRRERRRMKEHAYK